MISDDDILLLSLPPSRVCKDFWRWYKNSSDAMRQRKAPKGRPQWVTVTLNINKHTPLANTVCGNSKVNVREAEKTDYIRFGAKLSCYSVGTTQKEFCRSANPTKYYLIIHENNTHNRSHDGRNNKTNVKSRKTWKLGSWCTVKFSKTSYVMSAICLSHSAVDS